jgi:hypothetical protein
MYDDQPDSFNQAVQAAGDCGAQLSYAKKLSTNSGKAMVPGWSIANGGTHTEEITINQGYKRQWWIVIINCDEATSTPYSVNVKSVDISDSSKYAIDCSKMNQYDVSGYGWAIGIMVIAVIVAVVFAVLYWKKSTMNLGSGVTNTNTISYNEL